MLYKYILRFCVEPGFQEEEKLAKLVEFCGQAKIDDVMFFVAPEELCQGHLPIDKIVPWVELIARAKKILTPLGITTSINPWITTLHADRGRKLWPGQNFHTMVDPNGTKAEAVACPLCPEWRKYSVEAHKLYASIEPDTIWVEDDFRLHNHWPPLEWGGCFCDLHMAEFSRLAGRQLTREEFVKGMLQPGEPHPFRKIWLDVARDSMADLAKVIGDAVHSVSPSTKVGLMSSAPFVHCAEARDWSAILYGLTSGCHEPVDRIHLPAYSDKVGWEYLMAFEVVSSRTAASIPASTEIYPELESFPHTTFSKSRTFTQHQIESALAIGTSGMTFNIYPMMADGIWAGDRYDEPLAGIKPYLNSVTELGLSSANRQGVKILSNTKSSYALHTPQGSAMSELYPDEQFWAGLLIGFGVTTKHSVDALPTNDVVAVSGQFFRSLDKPAIEKLFAENHVLLEGDGAYTLYQMGLGELAGIKSAEWRLDNTGYQAYEALVDGEICRGTKNARISAQCGAGDFLDIEYSGSPKVKSLVYDPAGKQIATGVAIHEDRVFILPYGRFARGFSTHLSAIRQDLIQRFLESNRAPKQYPFARALPFLGVYAYDLGEKVALLLVNAALDPVEQVCLFAPGLTAKDAVEITRQGPQPKPADLIQDGEDVVYGNPLASLETRVLVLPKGQLSEACVRRTHPQSLKEDRNYDEQSGKPEESQAADAACAVLELER